MKKTRKHALISLLVVGGSIIAFALLIFFFVMSAVIGLGEISTARFRDHYKLSDGNSLVVDTFDCGAACTSHTEIYKISSEGVQSENIVSCKGVSDIELKNITDHSALISKVTGSGEECHIQEGDTINY
jgi:hypothetical protein